MKFKSYFPLVIFALISSAIFFSARYYFKKRLDLAVSAKKVETNQVVDSTEPKITPPVLKKDSSNKVARFFCAEASSFICSQPWKINDPTGMVTPDINGEIRALRMMRNILNNNPKLKIDQVENKLIEEIYTRERRDRIKEGFSWARTEITSFIKNVDEKTIPSDEKKILITRLEKVKLELPPPIAIYKDATELYTKNAIYYERTPNGNLRVRMGGAFVLNSSSWFNLIFSLAHELAHSIDPCELKNIGKISKAYSDLTQCFYQQKWIETQEISCEHNDRISEVFADWVASYILGAALKKNSQYELGDKLQSTVNAVRDLCEQTLVDESSSFIKHHPQQVRIGEIYGNNPLIRKELDCPRQKTSLYCHWPIKNNGENNE